MLTPKISVIVPVYNVEEYLKECLDSLVNQTLDGLEVIMMNDGSTDSSQLIMENYASEYENFKAYYKENGGLGQARNFGVKYATGEYIAFLDSDDYVAVDAYQKMYETAKKTGSDIVIGNVERFNSTKIYGSGLHKKVFRETILATHITKNPELIYDTTAWNKLFKKSFWDEHQFQFPEGMLYEDLPVTIPAHYLSTSTDVIADVVYYWRARDGVDKSITQKRHELNNFMDRLTAVKMVDAFFDEHQIGGKLLEMKDYKALSLDIKMYLNELFQVDDHYMDVFMKEVQEYLKGVEPESFSKLDAIDRVKYYLLNRGEKEKLLKVLYFQKNKSRVRKTLNKGRSLKGKLLKLVNPRKAEKEKGFYGNYPFKNELPKELFKMDYELRTVPKIERVRWKGSKLIIKGFNYISKVDMKRKRNVQLTASLKNTQTGKQVEIPVRLIKRPDVTRRRGVRIRPLMRLYNYKWSGYELKIDFADPEIFQMGQGRLELWFTLTVDGLTKEFRAGGPIPGKKPRPSYKTFSGRRIIPDYNKAWDLALESDALTSEIEKKEIQGNSLKIQGWTAYPLEGSSIELFNGAQDIHYYFPLEPSDAHEDKVKGHSFQTAIDLSKLEKHPENLNWTAWLYYENESFPVTLSSDLKGEIHPRGSREVRIMSDKEGHFAVDYDRLSPSLVNAKWEENGLKVTIQTLEVALNDFERVDHVCLSLLHTGSGKMYTVPCQDEIREGDKRLYTGVIPQTDGQGAGLFETGKWELYLETHGKRDGHDKVESGRVRVEEEPNFTETLASGLKYKPYRTWDGYFNVHIRLSWRWFEDGPRRQKAVGLALYPLFRLLPMNKRTVILESYWGQSYSCNPRAIYEYMDQSGMDYKYVWILNNENIPVNGKAKTVRKKTWKYFFYLATAKYFINNANFPDFYIKRKGAVEIQTLHGTFLKTMGLDIPGENDTEKKRNNFLRRCGRWDYLLSPSSYMTRLSRHCFDYHKEILECGFPRNDVLKQDDTKETAEAIKRKLGLPLDKKVILYAPTWRVKKSFNFQMDLEQMQRELGDDHILLLRLHYFVSNSVDTSPFRGFAYNLSAYDDIQDLYLISDLLITDYSSVMFDYANLNRPIFFFTYDLELYRDQLRGFYMDLEEEAPGPLVKTTEELANSIQDIKQYDAFYRTKLDRFRSKYCEFDKGDASERVVKKVFLNESVDTGPSSETITERTS